LNGDIEIALRETDAASYTSIPGEWHQTAYEAIDSFQEEASIEPVEVSIEYLRTQLRDGMGDTLAMQFTAEGAIRPLGRLELGNRGAPTAFRMGFWSDIFRTFCRKFAVTIGQTL
jgi:hypothetical protein